MSRGPSWRSAGVKRAADPADGVGPVDAPDRHRNGVRITATGASATFSIRGSTSLPCKAGCRACTAVTFWAEAEPAAMVVRMAAANRAAVVERLDLDMDRSL